MTSFWIAHSILPQMSLTKMLQNLICRLPIMKSIRNLKSLANCYESIYSATVKETESTFGT